jgi:hypothetical protein
MLKIDPALKGSEFLKVLRYGGGKLGVADKYVVVDGTVQTVGELGDRPEVTLVHVDSFREQIFNPRRYTELLESHVGCENDAAHARAWLQSLQQKRGKR